MPTHPCFKPLLPTGAVIYGRKSQLACHHHAKRAVAFVPFTTGVSQGDGTGPGFLSLEAHCVATETLAHFPDIPMHSLSIMDDFHSVAPAQ